jgi:hypothetical protein
MEEIPAILKRFIVSPKSNIPINAAITIDDSRAAAMWLT